MKRASSVRLGPGAPSLILIFVALSLSALAVLSLMTARNDLKLGERSVQVTQSVYELGEQAEELRAQICAALAAARESGDTSLDGVLPEGVTCEDGIVSFMVTDGRAELYCELELLDSDGRYTAWVRHELTAHTEDDLWN